MSIFRTPLAADMAARVLDRLAVIRPPEAARFTEIPGRTEQLSIPTRHGPLPATLYLPPDADDRATGVYLNSHGGGFVISHPEQDDPWCRYLAANAGVAVLNVDYVVAPRKRFPAPVEQVYDAVMWASQEQQRWDGSRLAVGGQSAGGSISAGVARIALETEGSPRIALQVLHYAVLDLVTPLRERHSPLERPLLTPWLGEIFNNAYIPEHGVRTDRLASPDWGDNADDIAGIAPALVVTCEYDRLRAEGAHYARILEQVGALREHIDVEGVDHGYNLFAKSRQPTEDVYRRVARHVREALATP